SRRHLFLHGHSRRPDILGPGAAHRRFTHGIPNGAPRAPLHNRLDRDPAGPSACDLDSATERRRFLRPTGSGSRRILLIGLPPQACRSSASVTATIGSGSGAFGSTRSATTWISSGTSIS